MGIIKVSQKLATEMLVHLDWPSCVKWPAVRLQAKLNTLTDFIKPDEPLPREELIQLRDTVLAANGANDTIEIIEDGTDFTTTTAPAAPQKPAEAQPVKPAEVCEKAKEVAETLAEQMPGIQPDKAPEIPLAPPEVKAMVDELIDTTAAPEKPKKKSGRPKKNPAPESTPAATETPEKQPGPATEEAPVEAKPEKPKHKGKPKSPINQTIYGGAGMILAKHNLELTKAAEADYVAAFPKVGKLSNYYLSKARNAILAYLEAMPRPTTTE